MARRRLVEFRWPSHVGIVAVVLTSLGALALVVLAVVLTNEGPTCGGQQMGVNDQCVSSDGSVASYDQVAGSPLPSIVFAAAVGLVGTLVLRSPRYGRATATEGRLFQQYVAGRRAELRAAHETDPAWRAKFATPEDLMARFDREVARVRKRKHLGPSKKDRKRARQH